MIYPLLKLAMVISGIGFYWAGEIYKKEFKYAMGIPISLLALVSGLGLSSLWCILTYFFATWGLPYSEKSPTTKLFGNRGAITIAGCGLGLASFPIIGLWCILGGIISGLSFFVISILDDKDIIKEPFVAILRGLCGTILLIV